MDLKRDSSLDFNSDVVSSSSYHGDQLSDVSSLWSNAFRENSTTFLLSRTPTDSHPESLLSSIFTSNGMSPAHSGSGKDSKSGSSVKFMEPRKTSTKKKKKKVRKEKKGSKNLCCVTSPEQSASKDKLIEVRSSSMNTAN